MNIVIFKNLRKVDKKEAITDLLEHSSPRQEFYVMAGLSTLLATLGIVVDSVPVIIGSMIVAPLLYPVLSMSLALTLRNWHVIWQSLQTALLATIISLGIAVVFGFMLSFEFVSAPDTYFNSISITVSSILIALVSGFLGAFSITKSFLNQNIVGVAISVALIPPLAAAGTAIGIGDFSQAFVAFGLYLLNLVFITIGASIVFLLMDFTDVDRAFEREYDEQTRKLKLEEKRAEKNG